MTTNDEVARHQFVAAANDLIRLMREHGINHVSLFPKPSENGSTALCGRQRTARRSGEYHNCNRCKDGTLPERCRERSGCGEPHAKND